MKISTIVTLFQRKKYIEAIEYIRKQGMETLAPREISRVLYYEGLCCANIKQYDKALAIFNRCITSSSVSIEYVYQCRMLRGYIYTITKRQKLAEGEFLQLLKEGYESAKIYAAIAHVVYELDRAPEAVKYLQKALDIDPENINAMNSMAHILSENNVKLPLALKYIEKVLDKHPKNPAYLDTYGLVLLKLKRVSDARQVLQMALTLKEHPDIRKHYELTAEDVEWDEESY